MIHMPCDSTRFRLLPFDFDYIFLCRNFYNITRNVNNMQPLTLNLRTVRGTGGFTVTWFVAMFENLTNSVSHMPYLEILKGWLKDSIFARQHKMAQELLSSLLINQKRTF